MSLALDNIGLKFGPETVIGDVSLTLERGKMNVLLGPTLAGQTSLLRLMAGLDKPNASSPTKNRKARRSTTTNS
jgi:glycerol transport system ATP-binding protein